MRDRDLVPYIGITDFTSPEQVTRILRVPYDRGIDTKMNHVLGVGVMMSYKTLLGLPTKWSVAFPPKETVADIFIDHGEVFNVLHYADYDATTTDEDLDQVIAYGGPNLDAIQLDMVLPDPELLCRVFDRHRGVDGKLPFRVILQMNGVAMEKLGDNPSRVMEAVYIYHSLKCLNYVLFDKSMGKGLGMNAELLLTYCAHVRQRLSKKEVMLAVAGGLGPTTVSLLNPFRRENIFGEISCDAQGKLRPSSNALDPIDWTMAEDYFAQACLFFGGL